MPAERIWLDVPYAEKDLAKAEGARWDARARRWYAPRPGMAGLERWAARPDIPTSLPGEDRSLGSGLFVDLVPTVCCGSRPPHRSGAATRVPGSERPDDGDETHQ